MNINNTTFPHPILGIGDSITGTKSLMEEILSYPNSDFYEVKVDLQHDNKDLLDLINSEKAKYFCEVTCTHTVFRQVFTEKTRIITFKIPKKKVKGRVEFTCLLVATEDIANYSNSNAHPDYAGYAFDIDKGDILAYFGEFSFDADIQYEKLKAVSSFMEVVPKEDDSDLTEIDLESPKIIVKLPKIDHEIFSKSSISKNSDFTPIIHSSIVLNALIFALFSYRKCLEGERLWARTLEQRFKEEEFKNLSIDEPLNIPEIAQRLLGNPFTRLISELNNIVETQTDE